MRLRALRTLSVLSLLALLAGPATTAQATTHTPKSKAQTSVRGKGKKAKLVAKKRSVRRGKGRRVAPPAGGVYARNAILVDPSSGEVLFEKNSARSVPVASLTKLMTALVFLEQKPDLEREVAVTHDEIDGAGHSQLRDGEMLSLEHLLHMSLMCSDNVATRVLAREAGMSHEDFLARMNRKAVELGLSGSRFYEVTGLDERNVSTASDIARLLHAAAHDPLIQTITTTRAYEFRTDKRAHAIHNTNRLLYGRYEVLGGKTGFIMEAGYCFATWVHSQGRDLIAVVLGAPTNATRFADAVRLIQKSTAPTAAPSNL